MRKVTSYIFAVFIMVDTAILIMSISFLISFDRETFYLAHFESSTYIRECTESIQNGISDISLASGVPEKIVFVTEKDVSNELHSTIVSYYKFINGDTKKIHAFSNTDPIALKLRKQISDYNRRNGAAANKDTASAIDRYIAQCVKVMNSNLIQIPYDQTIALYMRKLLKIVRIAVGVSAVCLVCFLAVPLFWVKGKFCLNPLYTFYGLSCGGVLVLVFAALPLLFSLPYKLNFAYAAAQNLFGSIVTDFLFTILIIAAIPALVGILLSILTVHLAQSRDVRQF